MHYIKAKKGTLTLMYSEIGVSHLILGNGFFRCLMSTSLIKIFYGLRDSFRAKISRAYFARIHYYDQAFRSK